MSGKRVLFPLKKHQDSCPKSWFCGLRWSKIPVSRTSEMGFGEAFNIGSFFRLTQNWVVVSNMFYFHPYLGKIPILTNIFQRGWNHQLEKGEMHLDFLGIHLMDSPNHHTPIFLTLHVQKMRGFVSDFCFNMVGKWGLANMKTSEFCLLLLLLLLLLDQIPIGSMYCIFTYMFTI